MSRFQRILRIAMVDWDDHDVWGTAMGLFFDVASVLDMTDIEGDVTPKPFSRWDYHRAPFFTIPSVETVAERMDDFSEGEWAEDYSYAQVSLASAYVAGDITQADLIYAGDVLNRYTSILNLSAPDAESRGQCEGCWRGGATDQPCEHDKD